MKIILASIRYITRLVFVIFLFLFYMLDVYALEQNEKLWMGVNFQQPLSADKQWLYLLYTQTRFINKSHPWQNTLFEGGIGRVLNSNAKLWVGYRWSAHNPNNGFYQGNRLWQQLSTDAALGLKAKWYTRTRLEESMYSDESQVSFRLRERVSLEMLTAISNKIYPLVYDELFFQLNKTDYTSHQLVSQNRLFLGAKVSTSSQTFWEIGYINQYEFNEPTGENEMNHIASFTYNFI